MPILGCSLLLLLGMSIVNDVDENHVVGDGTNTADDQWAELQLLTRADNDGVRTRESRRPPLVRGGSTLMLDIEEHPNEDDEEDGAENTSVDAGGSSFTALLAASRRLAGSSPGSQADSQASAFTSPITPELWNRGPLKMATVCEENDDLVRADVPETSSSSDPFCRGEQTETNFQAQSCLAGNSGVEERGEEDEDKSGGDPAFEEMLEQLPHDLSFLVLSVGDLSASNLARVRDAIAEHISSPGQQDEPCEMNASTTVATMRMVRTMMAVDTLRLFLLRYEEEEVLLAVTDAIRRIFEQYVRDHGVGPLSHSHCVLTSSNIARTVLLVRDTLKSRENAASKQPRVDNNTAERSLSPRRSKRSPMSRSSNASPSPCLSRRSPSSTALSPRSSSSPSSTSRRSILASEGVHVLMNEKIAAFQHRGDVHRLPSFKVRRESEAAVEEAAKRRQRLLQYSNEVKKALHRV